MMELFYVDSNEQMSQQASDILLQVIRDKPDALLCIATGASPTRTYQLLVEKIQQQKVDTSKLWIVKLDEWCGLPLEHPSTCEHYVVEHILKPLSIPAQRYISFDSMNPDTGQECARITREISQKGGIDCCVLGIGKNGHLGLNEPAESINPFAHRAVLDEKTKTHSMLAVSKNPVSEGYTLGIKDILHSARVLLLVTGQGKKEACRQLERKEISSRFPANYLWLHSHVDCLINKEVLQ